MLGYTAGGWCQYEAYRPTVKSFSDEVVEARKAKLNPSARVCLPHGWDFDIINGKGLLIEPSEADYVRFVKAFGYVAHLDDSSSDDTPDAFTATVVVKLPFFFGEKEIETKHSWAFARVNAFFRQS